MFCPKCGLEYRDGFTECAYCHIPLVDELPEGVDADELSARVLDGEEEDVFEESSFSKEDILAHAKKMGISEQDLMRAASDLNLDMALMGQALNDNESADGESVSESDVEKLKLAAEEVSLAEEEASHKPYRTAADRINDVQSSGYTLVGVGAIGLGGLILCLLGVVPISISGPGIFITYGTMGVLFLIFLVTGIRSLMRVAPLQLEAEREQEKIEEIEKFFTDNYDADSLDAEAFADKNGLNEDEYYARTHVMKEVIAARFMDLDASFLDYIVDDLYQDFYESDDDEDEDAEESDIMDEELREEMSDEEDSET